MILLSVCGLTILAERKDRFCGLERSAPGRAGPGRAAAAARAGRGFAGSARLASCVTCRKFVIRRSARMTHVFNRISRQESERDRCAHFVYHRRI